MTRDRPRYMPDVRKVLAECDPATFEERERKAVSKLVEDGLIRLTPEPTPRVSAPSPWAKDGGGAGAGELDRQALPSAMMPAVTAPAAPAEERPVTTRVGPEIAQRRWPATWIVVLGSVGFMLAVALLGVLVMLGRVTKAAEAAAATTVPASAASVTTTAAVEMPSTAPPVMGMVLPGATVTPAATAPSAVPTAPPSVRAAATVHPKAHDGSVDPRAPDAGAPTVEVAPSPPPSVFVNGPRPEF